MSWLDLVPTCSTVYIYQASLVCEDCAAKIMAKLDRPGGGDRGFADDGDSDNYPQGPHGSGGGESDNAQFCDSGRGCVNAVSVAGRKIGCPLGNPLTSEGAMAVRDSVLGNLLAPTKYGRMIGRLLPHVWGDNVSPAAYLGSGHRHTKLPTSLTKLLKKYAKVTLALVIDAEHTYHVGWAAASVDLLRANVDDEGEFTSLDVASVPHGLLADDDGDPRKLLEQAVAEDAWD
jgi:hypothetical protein